MTLKASAPTDGQVDRVHRRLAAENARICSRDVDADALLASGASKRRGAASTMTLG